MIDFAQVKKLSIGGIQLKALCINGFQVWKSGYKNWIEAATAEPGGTEIYNGTGYKDSYRWSLSGKKESAYSSARLCGWIPFVPNATYRIKNFNAYQATYNTGIYFVLISADGTVKVYEHSRLDSEYNAETDTFTIQHDDAAAWFRISGYKGDNEPIITMNEEIPQ